MALTLAGKTFESRLLLGTARYPSPETLRQAIVASGAQIVTVSLRREAAGLSSGQRFFELLKSLPLTLLPNTAGCHSVKEAVTTAELARDLFDTHWIKLEVIGDEATLQPDPFALVDASRILVSQGFEVFPYMTDDLVVAERLLHVGCRILMPWGSPIGSARGISDSDRLRALRSRFPGVPLIVDAGLGRPSHAAEALELGCDAVLLNTAVALAGDPVRMAKAFAEAVRAGRNGFEAGWLEPREVAVPSTPILGTPFGGVSARPQADKEQG